MTRAESGEQLRVAPQRDGETVVLVARGEVDGLTAPDLQDAVIEALAQQPAVLVIDLTGVDFLSSAGLAVLVYAAHAGATRTRVRVAARGIAARAITVTGLGQLVGLLDGAGRPVSPTFTSGS